ncbi:MAG: hypothetical protein R2880_13630 [Deinococcales bacterium]
MIHHDKFDMSQEFFQNYNVELGEDSYHKNIIVLRGMGFVVPDILTIVKSHELVREYGFIRDSHWSPVGASMVAEAIKDAIENSEVYKNIEHTDFSTELTEQQQQL